MILGVASGKGGTGKTTVSVNLAWCAPERALLLDCDVEEPNCHLFLHPTFERRESVSIPVPALDAARCTACGICSQICEFNAVAFLGERPLLFPDLCHGCGGCIWACPEGALSEVGLEIGVIGVAEGGACGLVEGRLHVGKALSPPLIRAVKRFARADRLTIIDAPPGTACPLAAALSDCDYVLLVAEPTRFGQHDLSLAVERVRELGIPCGVVINRAAGRNEPLRAFCREQALEVLLEIPESRQAAEAIGRGRILAEALPEMRRCFEELWSEVQRAAKASAGKREGPPHAHL